MTKKLPLATVLRVRDIEEGLARRRLVVALADEARAAEARSLARSAYDDGAEPCGGATAAFLAQQRVRIALAASVRNADATESTAQEAAGLARDAHTVAAMRVAGLERLTERTRQARRVEVLAAEQRTAEESAGAMAALRGRR